MRAMISPIIIIGIIILSTFLILEISKSEIISDNINNEILNDIKMHKSKIKRIEFLSDLNENTYECSKYYYCYNLTSFLSNVSSCLHNRGFYYDLEYDGEFYINVSGFKDILDKGRLNCG